MCQLPHWRLAQLAALTDASASEDTSPPDTLVASETHTTSLTPVTMTPLRTTEVHAEEAESTNETRDRNLTDLIHGLLFRIESGAPGNAAVMTNLDLVNHYMPYELLPPSLGALRLPNLRTLRLTGVIVTPWALLSLLREHKSILKFVSLDCVALAIPRMEETGPAHKRYQWTKVINCIRRKMVVEYFFLNSLTWCDDDSGEMSDGYLQTPQAKYHWKYLGPGGRERFKLSGGGLEANGCHAVRYGSDMFIEEVNKHPRRRNIMAARE